MIAKELLSLEQEFGPAKVEEVPWGRVRSPLVQFIADAGDVGAPGSLHARLEMAFLGPFRERLTLAWAGARWSSPAQGVRVLRGVRPQ